MARAQPKVCYVNEQGEIICGTTLATPQYSIVRRTVKTAIAGISKQRLDLIMGLIEEVMQSPINDDCIAIRSGDTVQSVHDLLQRPSPVMLLYRYVALPGNIMATYYVQQNKFDAARDALDVWSTLKPGC